MENLFLAKSNPKETIIEHTEKLIKECKNIKKIYEDNIHNVNWELLELACIYHDIGKMNTKFQNKIIENINKESKEKIELLEDTLKDIEEIPHGYLSNAFIPLNYLKENFTEDEIRILYESIFYHHNREKLVGARKKELKEVITKDLQKYKEKFKYSRMLKKDSLDISFMKYIKNRILIDNSLTKTDKDNNKELAKKFIMTKGLLNKLDYAASGWISAEVEAGKLKVLTEESITKQGFALNELQQYMNDHKEDNLIIKASTGIGKTEAALIWIGDNNKGFFTLPLKVSINSIYDRVVDKIGYGKEKTALLHSDSASEYMKRDDDGTIDNNYLDLTKQLSLPLTICTLDQLIGFIFKYEGFELKLATLSYSKLVIDEIQMYSPEMVAFLILALREIIIMGGKFAIVTATFPPVFEYFMNFVNIKDGENYIKPSKPFLKEKDNKVMLRHKIRVYKENISSEAIYNAFKNQKILVIVNTVGLAQKLYDELTEYEDIKDKVNIFHSRFIKKDRAEKEEKIFKDGQLKNKFEGIWITTQVVEASLDIDFDVLYTELSDISGLLQRMGRVYRNRILNSDNANIHIFIGDKNKPSGIYRENSIIDNDIFEKSKEEILKYDDSELDENKKMEMVDNVYSYENLKESDYFDKIKDTIITFSNTRAYDLKKNEYRLRNILTETVIPKNIYESNKKYIDDLIKDLYEEKDFSKKIVIKDEIMKNTVSIPTHIVESSKKKGAIIDEFEISKYESIKIFPCNYSSEKGLEYLKDYTEFSESQFI